MRNFPELPARLSAFRRELILKARKRDTMWASYSQHGRSELFYGLGDCKGFCTNVRIPGQDGLRVVEVTGPGDLVGIPARVTIGNVTHYGFISGYSASGLDSDDCVGMEFAGPTLHDDVPQQRINATLDATYKRLGIGQR